MKTKSFAVLCSIALFTGCFGGGGGGGSADVARVLLFPEAMEMRPSEKRIRKRSSRPFVSGYQPGRV